MSKNKNLLSAHPCRYQNLISAHPCRYQNPIVFNRSFDICTGLVDICIGLAVICTGLVVICTGLAVSHMQNYWYLMWYHCRCMINIKLHGFFDICTVIWLSLVISALGMISALVFDSGRYHPSCRYHQLGPDNYADIKKPM